MNGGWNVGFVLCASAVIFICWTASVGVFFSSAGCVVLSFRLLKSCFAFMCLDLRFCLSEF
jgi:hypothetical protein